MKRWDPDTKAALTAALRIASAPPMKQSRYTGTARVPWSAVLELRDAFDRLEIDWRSLTKEGRGRADAG